MPRGEPRRRAAEGRSGVELGQLSVAIDHHAGVGGDGLGANVKEHRVGAVVPERVAVAAIAVERGVVDQPPQMERLQVALEEPDLVPGVDRRVQHADDQVAVDGLGGDVVADRPKAAPGAGGVPRVHVEVDGLPPAPGQQFLPRAFGQGDPVAVAGDGEAALAARDPHPERLPRFVHDEVGRRDVRRQRHAGVVGVNPRRAVDRRVPVGRAGGPSPDESRGGGDGRHAQHAHEMSQFSRRHWSKQ